MFNNSTTEAVHPESLPKLVPSTTLQQLLFLKIWDLYPTFALILWHNIALLFNTAQTLCLLRKDWRAAIQGHLSLQLISACLNGHARAVEAEGEQDRLAFQSLISGCKLELGWIWVLLEYVLLFYFGVFFNILFWMLFVIAQSYRGIWYIIIWSHKSGLCTYISRTL